MLGFIKDIVYMLHACISLVIYCKGKHMLEYVPMLRDLIIFHDAFHWKANVSQTGSRMTFCCQLVPSASLCHQMLLLLL